MKKLRLFYAFLLALAFHCMCLIALFFHKNLLINQENTQNEQKTKKTIVEIIPKINLKKPKTAKYLSNVDQEVTKESKLYGKKNLKTQNLTQASDPLGIYPKLKPQLIENTTDDALPDVESGQKTELNTFRWQHATYFNRIKEKVGQIWSPQRQIAIYDPQGLIIANQDRVTVLLITIDRFGNLKNLKVKKESGVSYLDEEALRSFKMAAPFLYPPKEIFGQKEDFSFQFAFYLQINRGFSFGFE